MSPSSQPPKLKQETFHPGCLRDFAPANDIIVCLKFITGAKMRVRMHSDFKYGHQKAVITSFIYQNHFFQRFCYHLLETAPIEIFLSQMGILL